MLATIRRLVSSRPVKDFVVDFLTGIPAGWGAVTFAGWNDVSAGTAIWSFAIFKALIQAGTRAAIKWASSPDAA